MSEDALPGDSDSLSSASAVGQAGRSRGGPHFTEKTFYLEEFYGKSLMFAFIPPAGNRIADYDSLVRTIRELRRNHTQCVVIVSPGSLPKLMRRLGRLAPEGPPLVFNPSQGMRSRPYPPDFAVAAIWERLRAGQVVVVSMSRDDADDLIVFARELASRLRVFKLLMLDRAGGLAGKGGERLSFVEMKRIARVMRTVRTRARRAIVRAALEALEDGVGSVNLTAPRDVYEEVFSFAGAGTLFTEMQYGFVRPVSIDDFEEVEALIVRGQSEGFLLARNSGQIARILPSCFGYRIGDEHLAGICSLLTEPYRAQHAGEITALYTLTRFQREGVAAELVREVIKEARARRLKYVFACTSEERVAGFFARNGFSRARKGDVPPAKWRGYDAARVKRLHIFRFDLR
ncbi:MAG TPA: GNAT family N-acetyltransferase [Candidatus Binataceae bacterium]|nr:GNAT family N-acetyltransferase [Candidatus Binataceae bacterium]